MKLGVDVGWYLTYHQVVRAFQTQPRIADILYCVAGGNHAENGFLVDIQASDLDSCMKNNYYASAYAAQAMLKIWTEDDKASTLPTLESRLRQIVFINSAGAFLGLPGSIAYTRMCFTSWYKTEAEALMGMSKSRQVCRALLG